MQECHHEQVVAAHAMQAYKLCSLAVLQHVAGHLAVDVALDSIGRIRGMPRAVLATWQMHLLDLIYGLFCVLCVLPAAHHVLRHVVWDHVCSRAVLF
jgi:hypothetical protein